MDPEDPRGPLSVPADRAKWWRELEPSGSSSAPQQEELVEVLLRGTAPWGFTLRGGAEHREPLVITKVEEGSAAATVCLRAGDEMVSVNAVRLSGSRQEAISLVKSSHRTLTLVVRRYQDTEKSRLVPLRRQGDGFPGTSAPFSIPGLHLRSGLFVCGKVILNSRSVLFGAAWWLKRGFQEVAPSPTQAPEGARMVDVVSTRTMPSESEVRVARNFLTKILRSSMRYQSASTPCSLVVFSERPWKNDPVSRPHSWYSSKLTEEEPESAKRGATAAPVWQPQHETKLNVTENKQCSQIFVVRLTQMSSRPKESPKHGDQDSRQQLSSQIGSVKNMERLEPPALLYPAGHISPTEYISSAEPFCGLAGKKDAGLSCFSTGSSPPGLDSSPVGWKGTSAESMFFKGPQKECSQAAERPRCSPTPKDRQRAKGDPQKNCWKTRQYSDESPRYLQARTAAPSRMQSVGSYYRSLQDLPRNALGHKQVRHSTASVAGCAANPNAESEGHRRHYGLASKPSAQGAELQARQGRAEGWSGTTDRPHRPGGRDAAYYGSFRTNGKTRYSLPQFQVPYSVKKEPSGPPHLGGGPEGDLKKPPPACQSTNHKEGQALSQRRPSSSPLKCAPDSSDLGAPGGGKSNRRGDRYATALRNEIQQKRAQLQKSRSAATLTCDAEDEDGEELRASKVCPSSGVSFSNTYKDHLKEAQAKVLQATSFQRRDLEPFGPEPLVAKPSAGRVRGRRRLPLAKRTHSFSEPDKMDKVGVEGEAQTGSFGERRRFFESKPAFSRPVMKCSHSASLNADCGETSKEKSPSEDTAPAADAGAAPQQASQEQQRLGTFAEYQATWNKCKKRPEGTSQGRCHSTENILDADTQETSQCIHESSTARLPYQHDGSPDAAVSASTNGGAEADSPAQATPPLGPRSLSPSAGSQDSPPTPSSHLAPETAPSSLSSSCQRVPPEADPASFQPESSTDAHQHPASSPPVGPAPPGFPPLSLTPGPDARRGAAEDREDREDRARTPSPPFGRQRLRDTAAAALLQDDSPPRLAAASASPVKPGGFERPR
ncbi:unnamed protein product [Tetraodon nigroviridis]|uniref:(spotted green pufferfish) hypothetical protein n=1 Tax=Tetraodon nigroviridis TaxID=99883 RepID=Q4RMW5_TETNG|nr:unnamed protein product [Tetraodon nigroviridis]